MCLAFTAEYEDATSGRKTQKKLLGKLKGFISE